jgi:hypothetical protein
MPMSRTGFFSPLEKFEGRNMLGSKYEDLEIVDSAATSNRVGHFHWLEVDEERVNMARM